LPTSWQLHNRQPHQYNFSREGSFQNTTCRRASTRSTSERQSSTRCASSGCDPVGPVVIITLEDSTPIKLVLSETLSSASAVTGQTVSFETVDDIYVGGVLVIARMSTAWGTVTEAQGKRRMGRGGKLDLNIDKVRLADGQKAMLRAVKEGKGGGHAGAMTGAIVATSLVVWPAAPLFLLMHGKDITMPKGTPITAFINGDVKLDESKFAR